MLLPLFWPWDLDSLRFPPRRFRFRHSRSSAIRWFRKPSSVVAPGAPAGLTGIVGPGTPAQGVGTRAPMVGTAPATEDRVAAQPPGEEDVASSAKSSDGAL